MSEEKKGFFKRLVSGLTKTRDNIVAGFDSIFSGYSSIDEDFYEELEEILIMGDIGINATSSIIEHLKEQVSAQHIKNPMECKQLLINSIPIAAGIAGKYCFFKKLGFEKDYVAGVLEGIKTVKKTRKVPYRKEDFHNYLAIEWELIYGAALYIYEFSRRQIRKKMAGPAKS